jgi:hypothetical protein
MGGVVRTDVTTGDGAELIALPEVNVAVAYHASENMFRQANGILGLAYTKLNTPCPGNTIPLHYTFHQIENGRVTYLEPYFTQLEEAGVVANKFAFYTLRSMVNRAQARFAQDRSTTVFSFSAAERRAPTCTSKA